MTPSHSMQGLQSCDVRLGAALMQRDEEGTECAVAHAIRALHKSERPSSTPEKERLAVIWALEYLRAYIEGLHVKMCSDYSSVKSLMSQLNPTGSLEIIHKPGVSNSVTVCLETPYFLPDCAVLGGLDLLMPVLFTV